MSKYDNSDNYRLIRWYQIANGYGAVKSVAIYMDMAEAEELAERAANNKSQLSKAGPVIAKVNG